MYTFIASVILVTIISLCVFKNRFWENRFLILLFIAGTSLVGMVVMSFMLRNSLPHIVEVETSKQLIPFYIKDTQLLKDSIYMDTIVPNLGELNHNPKNSVFLKSENDTVKQFKSHIIFYEYGGLHVGWNADDKKRVNRTKPKNIYFGVCDENPRYEFITLNYDVTKTNWISLLPTIKSIMVLYIPQMEYDVLSDEYKREIPF
jgi:hypothetical protein